MIKKYTKEELLENFKKQFLWLSANYPNLTEKIDEGFVKFNKVHTDLMSGILTYLQWYPGRSILDWIQELNIKPVIKDVFYNYFKDRICRSCNGTNVYINPMGTFTCRTCHPDPRNHY